MQLTYSNKTDSFINCLVKLLVSILQTMESKWNLTVLLCLINSNGSIKFIDNCRIENNLRVLSPVKPYVP